MFRRLLIVGVIIGLCLGAVQLAPAAISAAANQSTPCADPTNGDVRAIIDSYNEAFLAHDVDALVALSASDIDRDSPRGDNDGADAMAASFTKLFEAYPDLSATINLVLADAPFALAHYTTTATLAIPFGDQEPTGEPTSWDGIVIIKVECGKISDSWSSLDQLAQRGMGTSDPVATVESDDATPTDCPALTDESATALMDAWYTKIWEGDLDQLAAVTTDDVYHHWAIGPDTSGQAAQLERLQATLDANPDTAATFDSLIVDGDFIAVHWSIPTADGDDRDGINIFRTECGLIAEVWSEMDITGLVPAEATPEA